MFDPIGSPPTCAEVVVTAGDAAWLAALTRSLVEDGLAACGQIVAPVTVVVRRDGVVREEAQARVALHTRQVLVRDVIVRVRREHPDEVPCVSAEAMVDGSREYLQWIVQETAGAEHLARARR